MVITRLKFDTNVEHPKVFFKAMRWLTTDEYEIAKEQGETEDAIKAITMTVAAMDNVVAPLDVPGTRPGGKPQPRPGAAARAEPKDDDEPPAPPPRVKKEDEPPAPAPRRGRPPKAKAEEQAPQEPAEPEPEPAVRAAPRPAAASVKPSLAKMAAEWDDEA